MISMKHMPYVVCYMEGSNKIIEINFNSTVWGVTSQDCTLHGDGPGPLEASTPYEDVIMKFNNSNQLTFIDTIFVDDEIGAMFTIFPTPYILPKTDLSGNYLNNKKPHNIVNIKSNHEFI